MDSRGHGLAGGAGRGPNVSVGPHRWVHAGGDGYRANRFRNPRIRQFPFLVCKTVRGRRHAFLVEEKAIRPRTLVGRRVAAVEDYPTPNRVGEHDSGIAVISVPLQSNGSDSFSRHDRVWPQASQKTIAAFIDRPAAIVVDGIAVGVRF